MSSMQLFKISNIRINFARLVKSLIVLGLFGSLAQAADSTQSAFAIHDQVLMGIMNQTFHGPNPKDWQNTRSFHFDKKTKEVYVLIPGIWTDRNYLADLAAIIHAKGHNVLYGTLPGHENIPFNADRANPTLWLEYADTLTRFARVYGEKVVIVGQSTGGQLAVRMAERNLAEGIILLQPLIKNTDAFNKNIEAASKFLRGDNAFAGPFAKMFKHALALTHMPYKKLDPSIKVRVHLADMDPIVYNPNTREWVKTYAPQAQIVKSYHVGVPGHMDRNYAAFDSPFFP